jgi:low affinity Fe/Cu permease
MKKSELIFSPYLRHPGFFDDIEKILSFNKDEILSLLQNYLRSKYRSYYFLNIDKFAAAMQLSNNDAISIIRIFDYFAFQVIPKYDKKEITSALEDILPQAENLENYEIIIDKFKLNETREILQVLDLIDDEIGNINPHFRNITYNIQNRLVFKDIMIVKKIPIVTMEFNTTDDSNIKCIMELLEEDIDKLIKGLKNIKNKLSKMSNSTNS